MDPDVINEQLKLLQQVRDEQQQGQKLRRQKLLEHQRELEYQERLEYQYLEHQKRLEHQELQRQKGLEFQKHLEYQKQFYSQRNEWQNGSGEHPLPYTTTTLAPPGYPAYQGQEAQSYYPQLTANDETIQEETEYEDPWVGYEDGDADQEMGQYEQNGVPIEQPVAQKRRLYRDRKTGQLFAFDDRTRLWRTVILALS